MTAPEQTPSYLDRTRTPEERTDDLLARMTLEEKVAQMTCVWKEKAATLVDAEGRFDEAKAAAAFAHGHGLGQVGRPSDTGGGRTARQMADLTNAIQRFFLERMRLPIPVVFHEECLHGHAAPEGTSFPQPIGLAATFDPDLIERVYAATAAEARARGTHQALTPVVDVAREPRWGRVEETFGEDPYLVTRLGVAAVHGFQGDATFTDGRHLIATLKHYAAHGQPESGTNCAPVNVSERTLRETFLSTFKAAIQEGGAMSVMPSYNEIDGVPSHANRWLLDDILRGELGFRGYTVSDYFAIRELNETRTGATSHYVARDGRHAAELAVRAGLNVELPDQDCYPLLVDLVREGVVPESLIDERVWPVLRAKFQIGLFDDPYVDPDAAERIVREPAHRTLALEAARKTITLLKNDGGVLPIDATRVRRIAVIGPNADREMLGGYSGVPLHRSTLLDAIRERLPGVDVVFHRGCNITVGGSWSQDDVTASDADDDRIDIREAAAVAATADVVLLAVGDNEQTSREAWAQNHLGDRTSLDFVGRQDELIDAITATGRPVVGLVFSGRPASMRNLAAKAAAILELWYLGQESGHAIADVVFGDVNPGGKLPVTIPRSVGHVPAYYNHKPSARRGYLFDDVSPLFAFGYGLSYTAFRFGPPHLDRPEIVEGESVRVSIAIANIGTRAGDEVVQLYVRDCVSSVTRPVKELKGFQRVTLAPGQSTVVTFDLTPDHLAFYGIDMRFGVEPGDFTLMVGSSSRNEDLQSVTLRVLPRQDVS